MRKFYALATAAFVVMAGCGRSETVSESLLWKISGNGLDKPSYLFGTHHFASASVLDSYPSFGKALGSTDQVVGELEMDGMMSAQAEIMEYAMLPEGTTYHDLLSPEQYDKLDSYLAENFGGGLDQMGMFKPAMITTMITAFIYMDADPEFDPSTHEPIDNKIQSMAATEGKPSVGLETIAEQMNILMNTEPLDMQAQSLLCGLEHEEEMLENIRQLNDLYAKGELQKMYDLSFNNPDDVCPSSEEFNLALNKTRNDNWMKKLPSIMAQNPSFIAVGAIHLAGEPGLVAQLRREGYTVEAIR